MKRKMRVFPILSAIFLALAVFVQNVLFVPPARSDSPACESFGITRFPERKEAPAFSLKSLGGNTVTLSDLRGKPTILFFWGSWCTACKEDMALLQKFADGKKDQITIFTIAVDGEREKRVRGIIKDNKVTLPVLLVLKENVIKNYGINAIPVTYLISAEGYMAGKILGQRDWSSPDAWSAIKEVFHLR